MCVCVNVFVCWVLHVKVDICVDVSVYVRVCVFMCMRACFYASVRTHTHTHTHMHSQKRARGRKQRGARRVISLIIISIVAAQCTHADTVAYLMGETKCIVGGQHPCPLHCKAGNKFAGIIPFSGMASPVNKVRSSLTSL